MIDRLAHAIARRLQQARRFGLRRKEQPAGDADQIAGFKRCHRPAAGPSCAAPARPRKVSPSRQTSISSTLPSDAATASRSCENAGNRRAVDRQDHVAGAHVGIHRGRAGRQTDDQRRIRIWRLYVQRPPVAAQGVVQRGRDRQIIDEGRRIPRRWALACRRSPASRRQCAAAVRSPASGAVHQWSADRWPRHGSAGSRRRSGNDRKKLNAGPAATVSIAGIKRCAVHGVTLGVLVQRIERRRTPCR